MTERILPEDKQTQTTRFVQQRLISHRKNRGSNNAGVIETYYYCF